MQRGKKFIIGLFLILVAAAVGCSSGGSSSGGDSSSSTATTTTTATASMIGTWKCDRGGVVGSTIVFYADKTGSLNNGATGINSWVYTSSGSLTGNILTFNLNSGQPERFRVDWDNTNYNSFNFTNLNPATPDVNHYVKS
jgi:hypothetical protein